MSVRTRACYATDAWGCLWRLDDLPWVLVAAPVLASLAAVTFPGHEGET